MSMESEWGSQEESPYAFIMISQHIMQRRDLKFPQKKVSGNPVSSSTLDAL